MRQLREVIEAGQAAGYLREGDSLEMAVMVWSLIHGMSTIMIGQKMPLDEAADVLTKRFVSMVHVGLRGDDVHGG